MFVFVYDSKDGELKMKRKLFKTCPCCGAKFYGREDFIARTMFIGNMSELGLYNCSCGTTLAIKN